MHLQPALPPRLTRGLLSACFFATGGTGLVYEILWSRHLQLLFGSTTEAVSVVLGVFMTGLGLGAHVLGRRVDASRSPLRAYGLLEIGVGAYALLTGPLLEAVRLLYTQAASRAELGPLSGTFLKLLLSAAVLLLPAFLMGGTLPALVRALSGTADATRRTLPFLYGLNTLGAVAGTLGTGLVALEVFGISTTMLLCALVNLALGVFAVSCSRPDGGTLREALPPAPAGSAGVLRALAGSGPGRFALAALFASGAATMGYEVVFTRVLGLVFTVSSYAFTIVLAVFLAGLALGALAAAGLAALRPPRLADATAAQAALAVAALAALAALPVVPRLLVYTGQAPELGFWGMLAVKAVLATAFLLPLSFVAGLTLPLLIAALTSDLGTVGRSIGSAYVVNTAGALAGSLATGFILVPALGTEGALRVLLAFTAAIALLGVALAGGSPPLRVAAAAVALGVLLASPAAGHWPKAIFVTSEFVRPHLLETRFQIERILAGSNREILFLREGRNSTVAATRSAEGRTLFVGAHPDASDTADMGTQTLLGFIPLAAHPRPEDVFIVGFGSGVTADVATRFPETRRVVIGEIERGVVDASAVFRHVNHGVAASPKVRVVVDDARTVLQTTPSRFDVVISEPSNPWRAGVANLFSADFYHSARRVLKPGGVFAQWTQLYSLGPESLGMVLRTFRSAFPQVEVWWLDAADIVLLGTEAPLSWSRARAESLLGGAFADDARRRMWIGSPAEFWGRYLLGTKGVDAFAGAGPIHTDDRPLLEFEAPRDLYGPDSRNEARLLYAKITSGSLAPPRVDPAPPSDMLWLAVARMCDFAGRPADAAEALERASTGGGSALVLARDAAAALDAGRTAEAANLLERAAAAPPPGDDARREIARARGRLMIAREDLDAAARTLEDAGEIEGSLGVQLAGAAAKRGDGARVLALARRILPAARLGGPVGQLELEAIWEMLRKLAPGNPTAVLDVVRAAPPADAGFAESARDLAEAVAAEAARRPAEAVAACARAEARGFLSLELFEVHIRSLRSLGRDRDADRLAARLRSLAPLAVTVEVKSPFQPGR